MLRISGLSAGYQQMTVLRGVSLAVGEGEFVAVLGPNGAGKTTLLRAVMGACAVHAGLLQFNDCDLRVRSEHERAGLGIGYVPDGRHVWPSLTVADNLLMGAVSRRLGAAERTTNVEEILDVFPLLKSRLGVRAGVLSGGEQQMLAIARALMGRPRLLLVDEPSTGLAPIAIAAVIDALQGLHGRRGLSILLVEQRADVAGSLCSRGYVLNRGEVVGQGEMTSLLETLTSGYFGAEGVRS